MLLKEVEPKLKPFPLTDLKRGECRIVSEYARVSKPFLRHRVTIALSEVSANARRIPTQFDDQYVVAPTREEAIAHVKQALGIEKYTLPKVKVINGALVEVEVDAYDFDVITLED